MDEEKQMTVVGMILIVGVAILALLAIRWLFGQLASGSGNPPQPNQQAQTEE